MLKKIHYSLSGIHVIFIGTILFFTAMYLLEHKSEFLEHFYLMATYGLIPILIEIVSVMSYPKISIVGRSNILIFFLYLFILINLIFLLYLLFMIGVFIVGGDLAKDGAILLGVGIPFLFYFFTQVPQFILLLSFQSKVQPTNS